MNKNKLASIVLSLAMLVTFTGCSAEKIQDAGSGTGITDAGTFSSVTGEQTTASLAAVTCAIPETFTDTPTILSEGPADTTEYASSIATEKRGGLKYTPGVGTLADEPDVMTPRKANNVGQIVGTMYDGQAVNPNFYYYRCMLNDNGKSAYDTIHAGLLSGATSIKLSVPLSIDNVDIVFYSVLYDDPQIVWAEPGYSYIYNNSGNVTSISPVYNSLAKNISGAKKSLENSVSKALAVMWKLPNNIERSKYAHDYLTHTTDYVEGEFDQNAYSALVQHRSVCAGYSQAYAYMMQKMGAPCAVMIGDSGGPHAWNIVMLDGESYVTDVTWDDPYQNPPDTYYYDYFNLTSSKMSWDHTPESPSTYLAPAYGTKASYNNYFGGSAYGTDFDDPTVISTAPFVTTAPVTTTKPTVTTTKPTVTTTKPTVTTTKPTVTTTKPTVTTTKPTVTTTKPTVTTTKPTVTTTKPSVTTKPPQTTKPEYTMPSDWDDYWNDSWWSENGIDWNWDLFDDYDDWDIDMSDYGYDDYDHNGWYDDYYYHKDSSDDWWSYLDPYWKKSDWTYDGDGFWYIYDDETGYTYVYDENDGSYYCMDDEENIYWYDSKKDDWFEMS